MGSMLLHLRVVKYMLRLHMQWLLIQCPHVLYPVVPGFRSECSESTFPTLLCHAQMLRKMLHLVCMNSDASLIDNIFAKGEGVISQLQVFPRQPGAGPNLGELTALQRSVSRPKKNFNWAFKIRCKQA